MYNQDKNIWESQSYRLSEQNWCRDPENQKDPKALYMRADMQLADLRDGSDNANAVYWMEQSAKGGHVPAMVAMGDLFLYGLAVKQSRKLAIFWYEKAAAQGDAYAQEKLEQLRKKRRNKTLVWSSAVTAAAAAVVIVLLCILGTGLEGVIVHENTDLIQTTTQEEFFSNLQTVLEQNDTQLMISGQVSTNRLMLKFEGEGIDLSQFPAATVIWGEDNYLVLQFASQEEAARCLDALRNMDNVSFVGGYLPAVQHPGKTGIQRPCHRGLYDLGCGIYGHGRPLCLGLHPKDRSCFGGSDRQWNGCCSGVCR